MHLWSFLLFQLARRANMFTLCEVYEPKLCVCVCVWIKDDLLEHILQTTNTPSCAYVHETDQSCKSFQTKCEYSINSYKRISFLSLLHWQMDVTACCRGLFKAQMNL